ncbi:MAG: hypothetical protein M3Y27_28920, partial [Acidobacteriota bacterium]|nr:hypothetical protein [Acidobacteriota bacterium]
MSSAASLSINFFSEKYSEDVNIHSGLGLFYSPFGPGIDIHITPESVFTSPRNFYSHAPESAQRSRKAAIPLQETNVFIENMIQTVLYRPREVTAQMRSTSV